MENICDKIYLGLGSNLGDRLGHIRRALELIAALPETWVRGVSSIYESQPRLYTAQPDFLNACARVECALNPPDLLRALQGIESALGRERAVANGPRTIDLDVLLYGQQIINEPALKIPHPALHQRAFVLIPLAEVMAADAPNHPGLGRSIAELLADCPDDGWVRAFAAQPFAAQRSASKKLSPTAQSTPK